MTVAKRKKPRVRVAESVAWSYRVDFAITGHLHPRADGDGVTAITGKIIHVEDGDGGDARETVAGSLHGYCVRLERVVEARRDLVDVFDEHYPQLCEVATLVWNSDELRYNDGLALKKLRGNLIIPWSVSLLPQHRSKGVGLLAVWCFLDYFGSGATVAILKPYPLNHQGEHVDEAEFKEMQYGQFAKVSMKDGQAKLAAHWGELGFKRIPGSDYFYLDMNRARPSLESLIKKDHG